MGKKLIKEFIYIYAQPMDLRNNAVKAGMGWGLAGGWQRGENGGHL